MMKQILACWLLATLAVAETPEKKTPETTKQAITKAPEKLTQPELEARFRETLNGAVFKGSWQMTNEDGLKGKAALSEPRDETYTISRITKVAGDRWIIMARVQYGDSDVTLPVPVRVVWAEDTPVITLDTLDMPGLGTYSARVMVYGRFYAGTWFGDCYGGILSGQILHPEDAEKIATPKTNKSE